METPSSALFKTRVLQLIDQGQLAEAETLVLTQQRSLGEDAQGYLFLGLIAYRQGNLPGALQQLRKALPLPGGNHHEISLSLAAILAELGEYQESASVYAQVQAKGSPP